MVIVERTLVRWRTFQPKTFLRSSMDSASIQAMMS